MTKRANPESPALRCSATRRDRPYVGSGSGKVIVHRCGLAAGHRGPHVCRVRRKGTDQQCGQKWQNGKGHGSDD